MLENVTFSNLNGGELPRRFAQEFRRILDDIGLEEKNVDDKRTLILEVEVTPGATGENAIIKVSSKLKLPAQKSKAGVVNLQRTDEGVIAGAITEVQSELFQEVED